MMFKLGIPVRHIMSLIDDVVNINDKKTKEIRPKKRGTKIRTRTSGVYFSLMVIFRPLFLRSSKFERLKTSVADSEMSSDVPSCICRETS